MELGQSEPAPEVLIYDIESENNEPPPDLRDDPEPSQGEDPKQIKTQLIPVKPSLNAQLPLQHPQEDEQQERAGEKRRSRRKREAKGGSNQQEEVQSEQPSKTEATTDMGLSSETLLTGQCQKPQKCIRQELSPPAKKEEPQNIIFYEESLASSTHSIQIDQTTRGLLNRVSQEDSDEEDDDDEEQDRVEPLSSPYTRKVIPPQSRLPEQAILVEASPDLLLVNLVPEGYKLQLWVTIERGLLGLASIYRLFLGQEQQFLLSAKKEIFKYYSNFIISRHPHQISRRKDYFGRLEGNFIGTHFKLYQSSKGAQILKVDVEYNKNIVGFMGPRTFAARKLHPKVKTTKYGEYSLEEVLESNQRSKLVVLRTEEPVLVRGKYRLDFGGKVRVPSAKNFILEGIPLRKEKGMKVEEYEEEEEREERVIATRSLLFGKISDNCYRMEVAYPLTVFEAFGICLTSLDRKLMVN